MTQLFSKPQYEVCRSAGDFTWLHTALLDSCPERIIPPLTPPVSLDGEYGPSLPLQYTTVSPPSYSIRVPEVPISYQ